MKDISRRISALTPEQRALFEARLKLEGRPKGVAPAAAAAAASQAIPRLAERDRTPLSFAQARLWFIEQLQPGGAAYNVPTALRLTGRLDVEALGRSLEEIVRRHEALRTTFHDEGGSAVQRIAPELALPLRVIDLTARPEAEREREAVRLATEDAHAPFDLSTGPLARASLLRLAPEEHVLLFTLHHIISDGWSLGVLVRETAALYEAYTLGRPSPLPGLEVQYADYAAWQREWLRGEALEAQLSYWKRRLGGAPPVLELPADRPRPALQTYRGAWLQFSLPRDLSQRLKALAREEGATLYMTLLAAFQLLLARYTGQTDIVVGTPNANRNRAEVEPLIGFFVNMLVLRTDLSGRPTFRELLGRVRETTLGAYAHQDLPFERLVEELQPARDLSRNPVFQVIFALQNAPGQRLDLPGLTLRSQEYESTATRFDLEAHVWDTPVGLGGMLVYCTDLFDKSTAQRIARHFERLLAEVAEDPNRRVTDYSLLDESERRKLLVGWNDTAREFPRDHSIARLFERQAEATPDATALVFKGARPTYAELNASADRLARRLRARGVGPDVLVGLCAERSTEMIVALLAILKAGGAYVPLDPTYPSERVAFMLEDSGASAVLTQQHLLPLLASYPGEVICLDSDPQPDGAGQGFDASAEVDEESLAYVIYTSGSTGRPKGVMSTHGGAVNRFRWMWETYPFAPGEVCCQKTSLNFGDSVWEIFGPLLRGVPLVIVNDDEVRDPLALIETLSANRVTRIVVVPTLLAALLDSCDDLQARLPELKYWTTSGEALTVDLLERFRERMPAAVLLNLYGSSEVSADVTWCELGGAADSATVPIGRPIANTRVYILNPDMQPAPLGVAGELHVGGAGLARGYLRRAGLTAETFIPDPFGGPGARLYRTGDLARYLPGGEIEFLGRVDHQVKIRGYRIELGEIKVALTSTELVEAAVVVAREDVAGHKRLVAYVTVGESSRGAGEAEMIATLRQALAAKLPEYMVPSAFVVLGELPLTPSGKIDRKALPAPGAEQARSAEYVAPRGATERAICEVWQEVFGLERVGAEDNFFSLGGDSILSIRVVSLLKARGISVNVRDIFQHQTVELLARQAGEQRPEGEASVDARQIAQMMISEHDELGEDAVETIL